MKLTCLRSATVILEMRDVRILMDPWLIDGEYYGAWAQYPPFDWSTESFDDIDYIYVSHIHPDHFSRATMARLPKHIPVLIAQYVSPFLKRNIEGLGFEVRELPHGKTYPLKAGVGITILAADDCNPQVCGKHFGCPGMGLTNAGSHQVDSLAIVSDDENVVVNVNDCPYPLVRSLLPRILAEFGHVDLLLTAYSGAGPYPQCFPGLSHETKVAAAEAKKERFLKYGVQFARDLKAKSVLPFAGQYMLCSYLSALDEYRGIPEIEEAEDYFVKHLPETEVVRTDHQWHTSRANYREVLANRWLDYEPELAPSQSELLELMAPALERFERKRQELKFQTQTIAYVDLGEDYWQAIPMDGTESRLHYGRIDGQYAAFSADRRLLKRLLSGPKHAHWNNADIGSHLTYARSGPYEHGMHYALNFLHA